MSYLPLSTAVRTMNIIIIINVWLVRNSEPVVTRVTTIRNDRQNQKSKALSVIKFTPCSCCECATWVSEITFTYGNSAWNRALFLFYFKSTPTIINSFIFILMFIPFYCKNIFLAYNTAPYFIFPTSTLYALYILRTYYRYNLRPVAF
jgi:hypothetical protein